MIFKKSTLSVLAAILTLAPGTAAAQYTALPFVINPNQDPQVSVTLIGVTLRADVGFPSDGLGDYTPVSGLVILNYGRISASAGAGALLDSELSNELTLGASLGYDFTFRNPSIPTLTLQGAAGYTTISAVAESSSLWDIPVGVGASFSAGPPNLDLNFEPWLALRGHLRSAEAVAGSSETDLGFGLSTGLKVMTVKEEQTHNLGVHAAFDWLWIEPPGGDGLENEFTASVGLFFRWNTIKV